MKYLILIIVIASCEFLTKEEEFRIEDECYIANNPEIYIDETIQTKSGNNVVWAIANSNARYNIACNWYDAHVYINKFNCDSFPIKFGDRYYMLIKDEAKCGD